MTEEDIRTQIVATAKSMSTSGLSPGRSGNVSCRWNNGLLITPSALPYDEMDEEDVVFVDRDGAYETKGRVPSTEWRFHLAALETRPDCHAVVHTHSMYATVLACLRKPIPAFHYMVAVGGGNDIPLVPYAVFGSEELARHVADGLIDRDACLLANHGQVAVATTLPKALALAQDVETLAQQYVNVLQAGGSHVLSNQDMEKVLERFANYASAADSDTKA